MDPIAELDVPEEVKEILRTIRKDLRDTYAEELGRLQAQADEVRTVLTEAGVSEKQDDGSTIPDAQRLRMLIKHMSNDWYSILATGVNLLDKEGYKIDRAGVEWRPGESMPFHAWIGDQATGSGFTLEQAAFGCAFAAKAKVDAEKEQEKNAE